MAVIRVEKNKNFTTMSNYHLRDKELSLKAKGLLSQILSLPENWDYSVRGLVAICLEGKDCIVTTLQELERKGYLVRKQTRDAHGRLGGIEYVIYETPASNPNKGLPHTEKPHTGKPHMDMSDVEKPQVENPPQLNTNESKTEENKYRENVGNRHKFGQYQNVLLSDEDLERLRAEFPVDYELRIERLSEYMASSGKSYKNHLATIRIWARKETGNNKSGGLSYSHSNYRYEEGESL